MTHIEVRPRLDLSKDHSLRVFVAAIVLAVVGVAIWWMNSAWFLKSSSLQVSTSTVESRGVPVGEWRYFGIDVVNTTDKNLVIEDVRTSVSTVKLYDFHMIDPRQLGSGTLGVGAVTSDYLDNEFKDAWKGRQAPRGFVLEPGEIYQLILGLGTSERRAHNAVTSIDIEFTNGKFRGTTSATGSYQVATFQ